MNIFVSADHEIEFAWAILAEFILNSMPTPTTDFWTVVIAKGNLNTPKHLLDTVRNRVHSEADVSSLILFGDHWNVVDIQPFLNVGTKVFMYSVKNGRGNGPHDEPSESCITPIMYLVYNIVRLYPQLNNWIAPNVKYAFLFGALDECFDIPSERSRAVTSYLTEGMDIYRPKLRGATLPEKFTDLCVKIPKTESSIVQTIVKCGQSISVHRKEELRSRIEGSSYVGRIKGYACAYVNHDSTEDAHELLHEYYQNVPLTCVLSVRIVLCQARVVQSVRSWSNKLNLISILKPENVNGSCRALVFSHDIDLGKNIVEEKK
jgi:hypothetical protein